MEQRHRDRDRGHDDAGPADQPVGGALVLLDEFLGLAQAFGLDRIGRALTENRLVLVGHNPPGLFLVFSFCSRNGFVDPSDGLSLGRNASTEPPASEYPGLRANARNWGRKDFVNHAESASGLDRSLSSGSRQIMLEMGTGLGGSLLGLRDHLIGLSMALVAMGIACLRLRRQNARLTLALGNTPQGLCMWDAVRPAPGLQRSLYHDVWHVAQGRAAGSQPSRSAAPSHRNRKFQRRHR